MELMVVDVGNGYVKGAEERQETRFMHALHPLTDYQRSQVNQHVNGGLPDGYAIVNDTMYAYGEMARKYVAMTRRGAQRYTRDYYGVLMAIALAELGASGQIELMASYAPRDLSYVQDIVVSATGAWRVRIKQTVATFAVISVIPFEEPFGGYCRYVLNKGGTQNRSVRVRRGDLLVIDPGAFTVDGIITDGQQVDFTSSRSIESGSLKVLEEYERLLRLNIPELRTTTLLSIPRLQQSLITEEFKLGNKTIKTKGWAMIAKGNLVSDVLQMIDMYGLANLDAILVTGGGGLLIEKELRNHFGSRMDLILVDPDDLQMANVRGGLRLGKAIGLVGEQ